MPNNLSKTCSERSAATVSESFSKMVQLRDILSAPLHSVEDFPDDPFQTGLLHVNVPALKHQYIVSRCGPLRHKYSTLKNHTQVPRPPVLSDVSPTYMAKLTFVTLNAPSNTYLK